MKFTIKICYLLLLPFLLFIPSCRKDLTEKQIVFENRINPESVKRFLNTPTNITSDITQIIKDIQKEENRKPFLTEFSAVNGFPLWQNTLCDHSAVLANNGEVSNSKIQINGSSFQSGSSSPMYFIPLVDTLTKEVKSYIYCSRKGDSSFRYKVYNKENILRTEPKNKILKNNGIILLSVIAHFENTINKKKNIEFPEPYKADLSGTVISFLDPSLSNLINTTDKIATSGLRSTSSSSLKLADDCAPIVHTKVVRISSTLFSIDLVKVWETKPCDGNYYQELGYQWPSNYGQTGGSSGSSADDSQSDGGSTSANYFGPGSISGVYFGGSTSNYSGFDSNNSGSYIPMGGPSQPFWLEDSNQYNSNMPLYPSDLDNTVDAATASNFYDAYYALEQIYYSRPVDQYTNMSRDEFISMLQNDPSLAASIDPITILVKIGTNAAADVLVQIFLLKLTDPLVNTWGEAFYKIDWWQVGGTALAGLIPWRTSGGNVLIAAVNGATAAISDITHNGFRSWSQTGLSFVTGFGASLIGTSLADVISKFGNITNFGKALVTRLDNAIPYTVICKWLGGGLKNTFLGFSESILINNNVEQVTINTAKKIVGWGGADKVVIIGRKMEIIERIKNLYLPNAEIFNGVNISIDATNQWRDLLRVYNNFVPDNIVKESLMYKENKAFIELRKSLGYTFIDLGDPLNLNFESTFYNMEKSLLY